MNWDDLRYFLAVCREGSVKGAGESLGVSHTTVLRRMRAFETSLDTRLFDRTHGGYAMTHAASELFDHAVKVEAEVRAIDRRVYARDARLSGKVRVTASPELASVLIAGALPRFRAAYPDIELYLLETMDRLDLDAREADIAVRLTPEPPEYLIGRKVQPLVQGVYGSVDYLAARAGRPEPHDIIAYRWQDVSSGWVAEGFPGGRVVLRTDSPTTMAAAVRAGLGIALLPCFTADRDPALRRLRVTVPTMGFGIWVLTHPDFRTTARVTACRTFLVTVLEQHRALILGETSRWAE